MDGRQKTTLIVLGLIILCALVALAAIVGYSFLQPKSAQQPGQAQTQLTVLINSPQTGEQIPVGRPVHQLRTARVRGVFVRYGWLQRQRPGKTPVRQYA